MFNRKYVCCIERLTFTNLLLSATHAILAALFEVAKLQKINQNTLKCNTYVMLRYVLILLVF